MAAASGEAGSTAEVDKKKRLFEYAMQRRWLKVVEMYGKDEEVQTLEITKWKDTALHVAVSDGKEDIVELLVKCIKNKSNWKALQKSNVDGNTPLHLAAAIGNEKMCRDIGEAKRGVVELPNDDGETPLFLAASCGNTNAFLILHYFRDVADINSGKNLRRKNTETLLHCAIRGEHLDLAFHIIHLYQDLAGLVNKRGLTPLHYLATNPSLFRSGCHIRRFNKIIYYCTFVDELTTENQRAREEAPAGEDDSNCPDTYKSCFQFGQLLKRAICRVISNVMPSKSNSMDVEAGASTGGGRTTVQKRLVPDNYVTCFDFAQLVFKGMLIVLGLGSMIVKKMKHKKEKHIWSLQIMIKLVELTQEYGSTGGNPYDGEGTVKRGESLPHFYPPPEKMEEDSSPFVFSSESKEKRASVGARKLETPLLLAAKNGIVEMVEKILNHFSVAINDDDEDQKNAVLLAVENRQPHVYKLLLERDFLQDVVFRKVDKDGNGVMHLASKLVDGDTPWMIPGEAFQMQWELKWYEYIRDSKKTHYFPRLNKNGESPSQIFTRTHAGLLKSGGEWLTKTSESCSVVAALVATVAFATAATVPGGNDQNKGTPLLGNKPAFDVFAIGSLFALGFSITSLVMFLAILTSRYQEKDFLTSLPWKLLVGLTSLFMSIGSMLVAFCAGHFFVLKDNLKYAALPIYALTCLPVSFFAAAQFPLYFDIMRATFLDVPLRNYTVIRDSTLMETTSMEALPKSSAAADLPPKKTQ